MKHPTVILLMIFVVQISAFPPPHSSFHSKDTKESSSKVKINPSTQNHPQEILKSASNKDSVKPTSAKTDVNVENIASDTDSKVEAKTLVQTSIPDKDVKLTDSAQENTKSLKDTSSVPTNTEKEQKSSSPITSTNNEATSKSDAVVDKNVSLTSDSSAISSPNIGQLASAAPETPTARSNKDDDDFEQDSDDSSSTPTKIENMQRPPSYYYDMFNIPIAALQAVSTFLGGSPTNPTYTRPPVTSNPPLAKGNVRSPIQQLLANAAGGLAAGANPNTPLNTPAINAIGQISQFANNNRQIFRLPTIQDIINIPISTLNAVSHFLASNYATQPGSQPNIAQPVSITSNASAPKVPIETAAEPIKTLKSGQILQTLENIPDHSTLIGVTEEGNPTPIEQPANEQHVKKVLLANPNYYQDMINIPIATLRAVSDFLTTVNADPAFTVVPSSLQDNTITTDHRVSSARSSQASTETLGTSARVSDTPQVTDQIRSSENSVLNGPVEDKRSNEDLMSA